MINLLFITYLIIGYAVGVFVMFGVDDFKNTKSRILNCIYPAAIITVLLFKAVGKKDVFFKWLDK